MLAEGAEGGRKAHLPPADAPQLVPARGIPQVEMVDARAHEPQRFPEVDAAEVEQAGIQRQPQARIVDLRQDPLRLPKAVPDIVHVQLHKPEAPPLLRAVVVAVFLAAVAGFVWAAMRMKDGHDEFEQKRKRFDDEIEQLERRAPARPPR